MGSVTTLPRGRDFTRADLDALPDDGRRHELIDGALIVTPAPSLRHQVVVGRLHLLLEASRPHDMMLLFAPFDVALAEDSVLQPDLLVARRTDFTATDLQGAPLLAVEVLSPSTRHIDLHLKRARYETAGCPSYWVVDPDVPSVTVWELHDGKYVQVAHATSDDDEVNLELPYTVTLRPGELGRQD